MKIKLRKGLLVLLAWVIALGVATGRGWAQEQVSEIPTPKPPYVIPVPDYCHWITTVKEVGPGDKENTTGTSASTGTSTKPAERKLPPGFPRSIDEVKGKDTRIITVVLDNGTTTRFAQKGVYLLVPSPKGFQLTIPYGDSVPYPLYSLGFLFADFVGPETFKDYEKYKGIPCFHYKQEASADFTKQKAEAWIAVDSMRPVTTLSEGVEVDFQFLNAPTEVALTPEEQAMLTKQERAVEAYRAVR